MKLLVFYILSIVSPIDSVKQDSVALPNLEISAKQLMTDDTPDLLLEQTNLSLINGYSLSNALNEQANIYVRNYGPGTAATISMRGSGPSQTQLSWNDIPIASPTLGLSDLSLVHSNLFDAIQIFKGNHSAEYGSGAIGGRINLMSEGLINDPDELTINFTNGSFGTFGSSLRLKQRLGKIKLSTAASYIQSNNDFEFEVIPGNSVRQKNADFYSMNLLQGINYSMNDHSNIGLQIWAIINDRSIPPTITQSLSKSTQQDQSLKALLKYSYTQETWETIFKLGYTIEDQAYQDSLIGLFTENKFDQLFIQGEVARAIKDYRFSFKTQYIQHKAQTGNYISEIHQDRWSNALAVEWRLNPINVKVNSRFLNVDGQWRSPVNQMTFSADLSEHVQLKYNIGQVFRLPTLNDLYWRPGGNESLKAETGYESSMALAFSTTLNNVEFALRSDLYYRNVNDWILWAINVDTGLWGATNLARVESKGLDLNGSVSYFLKAIKIKYSGNIEWLNSVNKEAITFPNIEAGQQLFYTPKRRMNHNVSLHDGKSSVQMTAIWQDETLGVNENIASSTILNFAASHRIDFNKVSASFSLNFENLLNRNYFIIERRPMPGRNFTFGIQMKF